MRLTSGGTILLGQLGWSRLLFHSTTLNLYSYVRDRTVRRPPGDDGIQDHDKLLEDTIRLQAGSLATAIWQMLHPDAVIREWSQQQNPNAPGIQANMERDWNDFANNKGYDPNLVGFRKDRKVYATVSLEAWHDNIHGMIGTGTGGAKGQMGHPRWAGVSLLPA